MVVWSGWVLALFSSALNLAFWRVGAPQLNTLWLTAVGWLAFCRVFDWLWEIYTKGPSGLLPWGITAYGVLFLGYRKEIVAQYLEGRHFNLEAEPMVLGVFGLCVLVAAWAHVHRETERVGRTTTGA